ncbi:MAG: hypothetical protein HQL20_01615 [Candidatus Omnitrophica bacterium]|nr:hypothetical protein [Candidatus Omnitrophota bacterium]
MRFIFDVIFWICIIVFCWAFFMHTPVGARSVGTFMRFSGVSKTENKVASERIRSEAVKARAADLSIAVNDKLEAARDRQLAQPLSGGAVPGGRTSEPKDNQALADKMEALRQKSIDNQERAQAQRERMMAQKERLDALTHH